MEFWNNIVNTALLGTDKKQLNPEELPPAIAEAAEATLSARQKDAEERFLVTAAIAHSYRQCGVMPYQDEAINITVAAQETLPYTNKHATKVFQQIIDEDAKELLNLWLRRCSEKGLIVAPELIPILLHKGAENKKLRDLIVRCCGQRGIWLSEWNSKWKYVKTIAEAKNDTGENSDNGNQDTLSIWETGTPDERKEALQQVRATDPAQARTMLMQTWAAENVNTKVDLLKLLEAQISDADKDWLETLANDKSQKIKDTALQLLKRITSSAVMQRYQQLLQATVQLKTEKILLGLSKKTVLQIALPNHFDDDIFTTGIEQYSDSDFTENEFTLLQLISAVAPTFWEAHLGIAPGEIINYFSKSDSSKKYLPALLKAATNFKDTRWAIELANADIDFNPAALPLLPEKLQDEIMVKKMAAEKIVPYAVLFTTKWSVPLARMILRLAAVQPYQYGKPFLKEIVIHIPGAILDELPGMPTGENYLKTLWASHVIYITKLHSLKQNTLNAFA